MKIIIYPFNGGINIVRPNPACGLTIEEIARKDVPAGAPYHIVDEPEDYTFRYAWTADFSAPDGIGIGHDAWLSERVAKEVSVERS